MSAKLSKISPRKKPEPEPIDPEKYESHLRVSKNQHTFRWDNLHSYSVALSAGYGKSDFQNEKGLDHHGLNAGLAAGLRIPLGRWRDHILLPRLFYEYQGNHIRYGKDILLSRSQTHRFGFELNYLYEAVPTWLQIGGTFEVGMAAYRSKKGGLNGVWFNGNGLFRPLNSVGSHLEAGLLVCTFNAAACINAGYGGDYGLKVEQEGLNTQGVSVGLDVDVLRFFYTPTPKAVRKKFNRGRASKA